MRMIGIGGGEGGPADKAEANDEESAGGGPCARPTRGGKEARKKHEGGNEREAREDGGQQCADAEENHHAPLRDEGGGARSEEHTSALQSLMRISYAVLCWTKK